MVRGVRHGHATNRILRPLLLLVTIQYFVVKIKRAGKYNKYTYRLLTILYKTSYSKYCMTRYASVCCDSCLCGRCLHYNTTTCIYSYMSRIYHYVSRLYIIEGYGVFTDLNACEYLGVLIPKCAYTSCTKPEQSTPFVRLFPPHTYGLPTNCIAYDTTELPETPVEALGFFPPPDA